MATTWNYRVMVWFNPPLKDITFEPTFSINEVYYTDGKPTSYIANEAKVRGDDLEDIKFVLSKMEDALKKDILYAGDRFPEIFDYDEWIKTQKHDEDSET